MRKRRNNIKRIVIFILFAIILASSSYFIYADSIEKTTITCNEEKMFLALKNALRDYILIGDSNLGNLTIKIPTDRISEITSINLENSEIEDITGIEVLTSLTSVDLSRNKITDITPLENLSNITELNLNNNRNLGSSNTFGTVLGDKTNLVKLYISNIGLSNIDFIASLTRLEELYMASATLSGDLSKIEGLNNLTILDVSRDNTLDNIESIIKLRNLKVLNISNTSVETLEKAIDENEEHNIGIFNLTNLEELYLSGVEVETSPIIKTQYVEQLKKNEYDEWEGGDEAFLKKLKILDVSYVNSNGITGIISVGDCSWFPNLEKLYMQGNHITDVSGISELENLKEIRLAENEISDISPFVIKETEYDDQGNPYEVVVNWIDASIIDLHDNKIEDVEVFFDIPMEKCNITSVDLQNNGVYNTLPLERLKGHATLNLRNQVIEFPVYYKELGLDYYYFLLQIMQFAKDENSILYDQNAEYVTNNCTLNNDSEYQNVGLYNIIISKTFTPEDTLPDENKDYTITVTLRGGIADGTVVKYMLTEDTNAIDSLAFNDINLYQNVIPSLQDAEPEYNLAHVKIINVNRYAVESVKILNLSNKNISDLTGLEGFYDLENINVSNNTGITTLDPLKHCENINVLKASSTNIKNNYAAILQMKSLAKLILSNTGMTNISTINNLIDSMNDNYETINIDELDVSSNPISNIIGIEKITSLKKLSASNTQVEIMPSLETLENLETLNIDANKLTEIPVINGLTNLKYVFASGNKIDDISNIEYLNSNLIELDLGGNLIDDMALTSLNNVRVSKKLVLSGNLISDISPIRNCLATLQELDVSRNKIEDMSIINNNFPGNNTLYADHQTIGIVLPYLRI